MNVRIEKKDPLKIVGMSLSVLLQVERKEKLITNLHDTFEKRVHDIKNKSHPTLSCGVFIDPPNYRPDEDEFQWIAGVKVDEFSDIPEDMVRYELPENLYAIITYKGPKGEAGHIYDALYQWVDQSDYTLADSYGIEVYIDSEEDELEMDLCFPIKE
ncbi:GyrI-like domain-containing protein [Pseudogracilibacillus auburnensis]|uniref:Putative transcriptional regulator YdeE n=1 Tax=Pseudogracilibacillus auburnensis TaxID=1494959 RepID=A0A2V3VIW4_9BACI|nr:GyrI-like domain-containing protein [Pseudogracilibacillus auburnensis]PXW80831.1 putative transcriptional regulator YdeE [Pseudogracilibacillus auburnensis]